MGEIGYIFNLIFTFPIFNALMLLYHLFGDFALSIVVLTVIIKLVLFPLTLQQLKSSKSMQALQPEIAKIRQKYSKDQQAMLAATQALYKEYGVNPAAGCLPLLIQLPVLYGLFFAINGPLRNTTDVKVINSELYPFVPHFTSFPNIDLNWFTFINPALHISLGHPDPTHILPLLAGLATFIQLRMSQPKPVPGAAPAAANDPSTQSMKMMQYVMPVMITIFGWNYPAGLALYWTISSIFQAVQQFFVTGWGSLLVNPVAAPEASTSKSATTKSSYSGDQRKEQALIRQGDMKKNGSANSNNNDESSGPIGSKLNTSSGGSSSNKRRQRGGSVSARRRGSAQRSRG